MYQPRTLPSALNDALEATRGWLTDPIPQDAETRAAWLAGLRQLIDASEARFTQVLGAFDATGDGETLHAARSTAAWLHGALHVSPGDASQRVHIARASRRHLSDTVAAMGDGQITFDHLRAIERAVRPLPEATHTEATVLLTELAQQVDPCQVRVAGRALRQTVDPDGALTASEREFERRYLRLSPLLDGMTAIDGLLDDEAATAVSTALAPFLVPAGPDDDRTPSQRRADGLVEVATMAMKSGQLPELSGAAAHLHVIVPFAAVSNPTAAEISHRGSGRGAVSTLPECPGGSAPVPVATTERLACDALVSRVIMDAQSLPLDLGRAQLLFSPTQRRALALRDGGCRFPACDRPARYTDAHHVLAWSDGGASDVNNGLLLCRYHHRRVHEGQWSVAVDDAAVGSNGRVWITSPTGQRFASDPRGP